VPEARPGPCAWSSTTRESVFGPAEERVAAGRSAYRAASAPHCVTTAVASLFLLPSSLCRACAWGHGPPATARPSGHEPQAPLLSGNREEAIDIKLERVKAWPQQATRFGVHGVHGRELLEGIAKRSNPREERAARDTIGALPKPRFKLVALEEGTCCRSRRWHGRLGLGHSVGVPQRACPRRYTRRGPRGARAPKNPDGLPRFA
jgi:hypothetical protein